MISVLHFRSEDRRVCGSSLVSTSIVPCFLDKKLNYRLETDVKMGDIDPFCKRDKLRVTDYHSIRGK